MNAISTWTELALTSLSSMGQTLMGALPNIIGATLLIIIGWLVAKLVSRLVLRVLKGAALDKWTSKINGSDAMKENDMTLNPAKVVSQFVYWVIMLIFFIAATDTLGWQVVSLEVAELVRYLPKLFSAIVIFVIGMYIANFLKQAILATFLSLGISGAKLISNVVFYIIIVIITVTAMNQAGIDTEILTNNITLIMASVLFAFALAFGLGSKDFIQNILSGLYSQRSFRVGEKVTLGEIQGEIEKINSVNVVLRTANGKMVIPASEFITKNVEIHGEKP